MVRGERRKTARRSGLFQAVTFWKFRYGDIAFPIAKNFVFLIRPKKSAYIGVFFQRTSHQCKTISVSTLGDARMHAKASDRDAEGVQNMAPESEKPRRCNSEVSLARRSTSGNGCCVMRILAKIEPLSQKCLFSCLKTHTLLIHSAAHNSCVL